MRHMRRGACSTGDQNKNEESRHERSEIRRGRRIIAVPIDDFSVSVFQESQKTAIGAIPQVMASGFNRVAWFDRVGCHSYSLKSVAARCFQGPHLRLAAFGIFDLDIDP